MSMDKNELKDTQVNIIVTYLGKQYMKLPKNLWKMFRKFSLGRTPQEERVRLFTSSEPVTLPNGCFGTTIIRMLHATLQLDARLNLVAIQFVQGHDLGIDVLYKETENVLLIHERWLYFEKTHPEATCELAQLSPDKLSQMKDFSCDHIVEDLIELIVNEIRSNGKLNHLEATNIRKLARQRIRQMPRRVRISTGKPCELMVSWVGNESSLVATNYASDILYNITLHKHSSCQNKWEELIDHQGKP
jgi:hypothetical protein